MKYEELLKRAKKIKAVLVLEDVITHSKRRLLCDIFFGLALVLLFIILVIHWNIIPAFNTLQPYHLKIRGVFFILLSFGGALYCLEAFYYTYYDKAESCSISFLLAHLLFSTATDDAVYALLSAPVGWKVMDRLGIPEETLSDFLGSRRNKTSLQSLIFTEVGGSIDALSVFGLASFVLAIVVADAEFKAFLFSRGIQQEEVAGAADWVEEIGEEKILNERWWRKEALERISGLAKNWSYGQTYTLEKYGYDVTTDVIGGKAPARLSLVEKEVTELQGVLSRAYEANAVIVGDTEDEELAIVEALAKSIHDGKSSASLQHKRVFLLDALKIVESHPDRALFEVELDKVLDQAEKSGNTILVITQFPAFLLSAKAINSDIVSIIVPYLRSPNIQIIALTDLPRFHQYIESNTELAQHFETVHLEDKDSGHLMALLEDEAVVFEKQSGVFFTYQSLETIVESAERYFSGLSAADKCRDLLLEIVPYAVAHRKRMIERSDVLALVETKVGIPTGEATDKEKEKLLHLENLLHERIVGQEEAVSAISVAMRRARSDLANRKKPMGTFLFLGPTGVGKTETSKALADVFFGTAAPVVRLDMSEYAGADAMAKLIGSYGDSSEGVLSTALREHPYGVLLLDEFEKAGSDVLNIFLQILDEGFFSDTKGKKVSARNLIIIATSNAGSDMIFDMVKSKKNLKENSSEIIQSIISAGIFKPELLNRFDGVIIFHPLQEEHLEKVVELLLTHFAKQLEKKGLKLVTTPALSKFLLSKGSDPVFGARPMNRAISNEVESVIAEDILKGKLPKGSTFELVPQTLPNGRLSIKIRA